MLLSATLFSQTYIDQNKAQVKRGLKRYMNSFNYHNSTIKETDTTVTLQVREPNIQPVDFEHYFDASGKCYAETIVAKCFECLEKRLDWIMGLKRFGWLKLNDNKYVSKYSKSIQMVVVNNPDGDSYIDARKIIWGKADYKAMVNNR